MNLKIRDHLLFGAHYFLASIGKIQATPLEVIRQSGFQNILVVATTAIGDAVLCTPLIDSLRAAKPHLKIGFWVTSPAVSLFEGRTGIDEVIPYYGKYQKISQTLETLRKHRYDLALIANANDPDIVPLIWWSGCKRMIRRPQRHTIYSFMIANPEMLNRSHTSGHAIERNLEFCDLLSISRSQIQTHLEVRKETTESVQYFLEGIEYPLWIVHPGASKSKKQWGMDNYTCLIRRLLKETKATFILTGNEKEKEACDLIQAEIGMRDRVKNFAGKLRLDQFAALLKKAELLISGDTGPYHIAMAVGTATVTLFAPWDLGSSEKINGPFFNLDRHRVVSTQKMGDPISSIEVNRVFEEVMYCLAAKSL